MSTKDNIISLVNDRFESDKNDNELYNKALNIVKRFEGKTPSKRIATSFLKEYPELHAGYEHRYGMYFLNIYIPDNGVSYTKKSMLLCYDSDPVISIAKFEKQNTCFGNAAIERNQLRREFIENDSLITEISNAIDNINQSITDYLEILEYPNPDYLAIDKLVINTTRINHDR